MKHYILFLTFLILFIPHLQAQLSLVTDLNPGTNDGLPESVMKQQIEFNGKILLAADNGTTGTELYVLSNGTLSLLKDIESGGGSSNPSHFMLYNGKVYFNATTAVNGTEIWSTDGTASGTQLAVEVIAGTEPSDGPGLMIAADNGNLIFPSEAPCMFQTAARQAPLRSPVRVMSILIRITVWFLPT